MRERWIKTRFVAWGHSPESAVTNLLNMAQGWDIYDEYIEVEGEETDWRAAATAVRTVQV